MSLINPTNEKSLNSIGTLLKDVKDISRPNFYNASFQFNNGVINSALSTLNEILITNITLPRRGLDKKTINRMGHRIDIPGHLNFEAMISIKFHDDVEGKLVKAFQDWMNVYRSTDSEPINVFKDIGEKKFYSTLIVNQLDLSHNVKKSYTFQNVWPLSIQPSGLDSEATSQLSSISVSFSFSEYDITQEL